VLVFDFDGAISLVNASAATLLGVAQPQGKPLAYWLANEACRTPARRANASANGRAT
jgi:two-component system nitrogen regulation sensor histidine kinase NtrY